jgi:hypothetical protein
MQDCVNSCKTDNAANRIQANRVLENAIEDMRARGNDLGASQRNIISCMFMNNVYYYARGAPVPPSCPAR